MFQDIKKAHINDHHLVSPIHQLDRVESTIELGIPFALKLGKTMSEFLYPVAKSKGVHGSSVILSSLIKLCASRWKSIIPVAVLLALGFARCFFYILQGDRFITYLGLSGFGLK